MDAISSPQSTSTAATQVQAGSDPSTETTSSALASDFETFLRLLTTQLQNQDPSKPLDSTEFVAQLASFSAVEQQINTNKKLDELISQASGGLTSDLSSWIGSKVKSDASVKFEGQSLDVFYSVPQSATAAQLVVKNEAGAEVDRRSLNIAEKEVQWDGKDNSGNPWPNGAYSFEIEGFETSTSLGSLPAQTFSEVKEARLMDGKVELVFNDGNKMFASDVQAVRGG